LLLFIIADGGAIGECEVGCIHYW